jgi:type IV secretory pathway VirB2 component (pilin)
VDAPSPNVFAAAVGWLQATLLGTVATAVAVIAVASVGFLLLSGRIDVRRGAQVVCGCYILFGASAIASGIVLALNGGDSPLPVESPPPPPAYPAPPPAAPV